MWTAWRAAGAAAVLVACGDNAVPPEPAPPAWNKGLPDARALGVRRGLVPARGIVHLHSPYSHDACDGMPRDGAGAPNEACLSDLRAALCTTRIDFAALTDHDDSMADEDFATLFSARPGDEPVLDAMGAQIASRMTCDDGHVVTFTVGGENTLMPLMLDRHPPGTVAERHAIYNGTDAATVAALRDAGGLVWIPHTEDKPIEMLRALAPDGLEVYNLHANIDPDIRRDHLGLPADGAIAAAAQFADTGEGHPEPDLAMLAFVAPNAPAIAKWHTLLAEGLRLPITAGSDAHQNAIPIRFGDGERGDSYRRVLRWFSNLVLASDPRDPVAIESALAAGRNFAVMEVFGTPRGFDVYALGSRTYELGEVIPSSEAPILHIDPPTVLDLAPELPTPSVRVRVVWIEKGTTRVEQLTNTDRVPVEVRIMAPGAYRVEVLITPRHLGPYLNDLGPALADVEHVWIYTSPIYVE